MFTRYLKMRSEEKFERRLDKEIFLIVQDEVHPDGFALKITRRLLLEHSKMFRDMTEDRFMKLKKIKLEEVSAVALQKLVEFMKNGSASFLDYKESLETLSAAIKYQIESMVTICTNHLITVLEPCNVCETYETACSFALNYLEYNCLKLIDLRSDDVLKSRGFFTLKKCFVLNILKRSSLNISSEFVLFQAVLSWGLNDSLLHSVDPNNIEAFFPVIRQLLKSVRFSAMTELELKDPEVETYLKRMSLHDRRGKERSLSNLSQNSKNSNSGSSVGEELPLRHYVESYCHSMEAMESYEHTVKSGEVFNLNIEILKGQVFLTAFKLGFCPFAATKTAACLYVVVTATNTTTKEQRTTRGTFTSTSDDAVLEFSIPLVAVESQGVQIELNVKRAENICPLVIKRDVQIAMTESKAVAFKITPDIPTFEIEDTGPCILEEIEYFC